MKRQRFSLKLALLVVALAATCFAAWQAKVQEERARQIDATAIENL